MANPALHQRRLRSEHVHRSVKRCRIVKDRIRLWKEGVRDLVRERGCARHNVRVRLTPWQPMVESGYTPVYLPHDRHQPWLAPTAHRRRRLHGGLGGGEWSLLPALFLKYIPGFLAVCLPTH
jgi:hypothetical protein